MAERQPLLCIRIAPSLPWNERENRNFLGRLCTSNIMQSNCSAIATDAHRLTFLRRTRASAANYHLLIRLIRAMGILSALKTYRGMNFFFFFFTKWEEDSELIRWQANSLALRILPNVPYPIPVACSRNPFVVGCLFVSSLCSALHEIIHARVTTNSTCAFRPRILMSLVLFEFHGYFKLLQ